MNAPFGADWNDYPHQEKLLFYVTGLIHRIFNPGTAGNVSLILAHLSAALGFAWVARKLKVALPTAALGALIFAFCPFMMGRGLGHLLIAYVWHIPLVLYLVVHLGELARAPTRRTWVGVGLLPAPSSL